jgi:hypothetical protein
MSRRPAGVTDEAWRTVPPLSMKTLARSVMPAFSR